MNNSFVIAGNICQTRTQNSLDLYARPFVVCVDGVLKEIFKSLPKEYSNLPMESSVFWGLDKKDVMAKFVAGERSYKEERE